VRVVACADVGAHSSYLEYARRAPALDAGGACRVGGVLCVCVCDLRPVYAITSTSTDYGRRLSPCRVVRAIELAPLARLVEGARGTSAHAQVSVCAVCVCVRARVFTIDHTSPLHRHSHARREISTHYPSHNDTAPC
jgi:hypothetical protein